MTITTNRFTNVLLSFSCMSAISVASATTTPSPPLPDQVVCWGHYLVKTDTSSVDANRANIQSALDKAANITGVVELGAGTFTLSAPLRMPSGVKLCTSSGATLKWAGSSSANFAIENKPSATNIRITNLTFDGAGVWLKGASSATIQSNQFKNIQPIGLTATQSVYEWMGIKLEDTPNIRIVNNTFSKVAGSAIQGWRVSGTTTNPSTIEGNWFGHVNQAVSLKNAQHVTVKANHGYEIERMGIEFVREDVAGAPALDYPGISVINNQFANWRPFDITTCPDDACKERYNLIGLSLVSLAGANISGNILDCGAGCLNAGRGLGIEFSSIGTSTAKGNLVRGFKDGISLHRGQDLTVSENALLDVRAGITSTTQGTIDKLTVQSNQIEAAPSRQLANSPWGIGISPQWDHASEVIIDNNVIAYRTDSNTSPAGGEFVGIGVAQVRATGTPGIIKNNRVVIEGVPVNGFEVYGIRLSGSNGNLQGTQIENNWVIATSQQGTALDGGWQFNGTLGVTLKENVFQNLGKLNREYANHDTNGVYTVSGNLAINMTSTAAPLPNGTSPFIATATSATLPTIQVLSSVEPPSINATGTTTIKFTGIIGSASPAFNVSTWHRGDGSVAANASTTTVTYSPGATRAVRVLATNANKALITASRVITQK